MKKLPDALTQHIKETKHYPAYRAEDCIVMVGDPGLYRELLDAAAIEFKRFSDKPTRDGLGEVFLAIAKLAPFLDQPAEKV